MGSELKNADPETKRATTETLDESQRNKTRKQRHRVNIQGPDLV